MRGGIEFPKNMNLLNILFKQKSTCVYVCVRACACVRACVRACVCVLITLH